MEEKKSNKKSIILILILLAVSAAIISTAVYFMTKNIESPQSNESGIVFEKTAVDYDYTVPEEEAQSPGIKVPGYADMAISSESCDFPITLLNPEGNPCYFAFTLSIEETGKTIYTSDYVQPGQAIKGITLEEPLEKGEYTLLIEIATTSIETNASMNGAEVRAGLTVE